MPDLSKLKELIFETDDNACFIERERILARLDKEMADYNGADKQARVFATLLSEVSTPVYACDYFAGRVVEGLPDEGMKAPSILLEATGHMSFDYEKLLRVGLKGILDEICAVAHKKGDDASLQFSDNARILVDAIRDFAVRYADEAERMGRERMAKALRIVPFEPAYDFYSALQGIWLIHMIASCYVGARDYAFGKFDGYMETYYHKALENGETREELAELLAGFLVKTNEICGRCAYDYRTKPVLSFSSKQYVNIGGEVPNEFSTVVLDAAMRSNMAQPEITVLLKPDADTAFTQKVFEAQSVLTDKMNIYNYPATVAAFINMGIDEKIAKDYTYSACCTVDLHYHTYRREYYVPVPQILIQTLEGGDYTSLEEVLEAFRHRLCADMQHNADEEQQDRTQAEGKYFLLDALLMPDSAVECRYPCDGTSPYNLLNLFCPGIATVGDSLMVLDKLVFEEKRYTYRDFITIVRNNFENHEELRQEILNYTKFGNDTAADKYTVLAANAFLDAADALVLKRNFFAAPGFYSLQRDNFWAGEVGATPDGRKAGEPFSENQSPTYGADKNGITALLKSLSKLPFERTVTGGLNLTFSQKMSPDILQALVLSYFQMGGFHVGISVVDKETLRDAMRNPDKYKSLTVRLYGFSEYFVSLAEWQQIAVLNRTAY
ncbi:MAG: hypothetical protein E7409_02410 [Ruminococcaceae bacterium]|nr:hypothetical protein [Oscillospiraceae bacterium]